MPWEMKRSSADWHSPQAFLSLSLSLSLSRVSTHRANEDRRAPLMHASPNYVYARDVIRSTCSGGVQIAIALTGLWLDLGLANISVALIRTFPSLTYLPFAFIEHIFRIVCLANLISDQPFLSSSGVSLPSNEDQISSVTFRSFWVDSKIRSRSPSFDFFRSTSRQRFLPRFSLSLSYFPPLLFSFFFDGVISANLRPLPRYISLYIYTYIYIICVYI